jgi:hypothetical protein
LPPATAVAADFLISFPKTGPVAGGPVCRFVDIDHLIPFSDSWDDSATNKVICMRYANREKK